MKQQIVLPNVMTALGLSLGLFIIFKLSVLTPQGVTYEQLSSCLVLFIIAAVLDTLDGAIARAMRLESNFGGVFDSMSDVVTFGVAPAVFILKTFPWNPTELESILLLTSVTVYSVAGVLRLVRFSTSYVPPQQKAVFTGLPIPAAAFCVTSLAMLLQVYSTKWNFAPESAQRIMIGATLFVAYMMISRWRFPSLKSINIKIYSFHFITTLAFLAVLFFILLSNDFAISILTISWGYLFISWTLALYRLATGRRELAINDTFSQEVELDKEDALQINQKRKTS